MPPDSPISNQDVSPSGISSAQTEYRQWRLLAFLSVIGALLVSMIVFSVETGLRMSQRYTPLVDAVMEIKLEATLGHLMFEAMVHKDRPLDIDVVFVHLDQADWYARAMLDGGKNEEGTFIPLADPQLRQFISDTRQKLADHKADMGRLMDNLAKGQSVQHAHHSFEAVFADFMEKTDLVETHLQRLIKQAERRFIIVQVLLALGTIGVVGWVIILFKRFFKEQNRSVALLKTEILRRQWIEKTLLEQATTDTLTGLLNRRMMSDLLQDELNRAKRLGSPFSVIMFDIDLFKNVNDTFGHEVGDKVLIFIANLVTSRLRDVDSLARWGGEEFLILLPGTDIRGAMALANTCRERLEDTQMEPVGQVTASFGVADYRDETSIEALVRRADEALYSAKRNGRNRVEASIKPLPAAL